jgi:hypothetical protein
MHRGYKCQVIRRNSMLFLLLALAGCPSKDADIPHADAVAQQFAAPGAVVEKHGNTEVAWTVDERGHVKVAARTLDKQPITDRLEGELSWKEADGTEKKQPLAIKEGLLEADVVPQGATDVRYTLKVRGESIDGTVPAKILPAATAAATESPTSDATTEPTSDPTSQPTARPSASAPPVIGSAASSAPSKSGRTTEGSDRFPRR